jgi:hypothetical protein
MKQSFLCMASTMISDSIPISSLFPLMCPLLSQLKPHNSPLPTFSLFCLFSFLLFPVCSLSSFFVCADVFAQEKKGAGCCLMFNYKLANSMIREGR